MGFEYHERKRKYTVTMRDKAENTTGRLVFDLVSLRHVLCAPFESFEHLGVVGREAEKDKTYPGRHIYINRGSKVLGIAHLDTVQDAERFWANKTHIASPTLDNRLGAWVLLHGLPQLGITCDILFTENEEGGLSTGYDFVPPEGKTWNWMFSFDRGGTDVVFYQYGNGELQKAFKEMGFAIGNGSYSDIASMDHLNVQGANVGCGMSNYHSLSAHVKVSELAEQMRKFAALYMALEFTHFPYEKKHAFTKDRRKSYVTTTSRVYTPTSRNGKYGYGTGYDHELGYNKESETWDEYVKRYEDHHSSQQTAKLDTHLVDLLGRLTDEWDAIEGIFTLGLLSWLNDYDFVTLKEWRLKHLLDAETLAKPGMYGQQCLSCEQHYHYADTKYSFYFSKTLCKACYLEYMEFLQIMPPLWRNELPKAEELEAHYG